MVLPLTVDRRKNVNIRGVRDGTKTPSRNKHISKNVVSKEMGKGHATGCIFNIEQMARSFGCKEIWFPTVISPALTHILGKMNYKFANFGPHPMMPDAGDVLGYKKVLE